MKQNRITLYKHTIQSLKINKTLGYICSIYNKELTFLASKEFLQFNKKR